MWCNLKLSLRSSLFILEFLKACQEFFISASSNILFSKNLNFSVSLGFIKSRFCNLNFSSQNSYCKVFFRWQNILSKWQWPISPDHPTIGISLRECPFISLDKLITVITAVPRWSPGTCQYRFSSFLLSHGNLTILYIYFFFYFIVCCIVLFLVCYWSSLEEHCSLLHSENIRNQ